MGGLRGPTKLISPVALAVKKADSFPRVNRGPRCLTRGRRIWFVGRVRPLARNLPILPLLVIAGVAVLFAYALLRGDGSGTEPPATEVLGPRATISPSVQFVSPLDGATVTNPVTVRMAIAGLRFAKTSEPAQSGYGHLVLIIDGEPPPAGEAVPRGPNIIHLDDASHVTTLPRLAPGPHTLTVLFADSNEVFADATLAQTITVTVSQ